MAQRLTPILLLVAISVALAVELSGWRPWRASDSMPPRGTASEAYLAYGSMLATVFEAVATECEAKQITDVDAQKLLDLGEDEARAAAFATVTPELAKAKTDDKWDPIKAAAILRQWASDLRRVSGG